MMRAFICVVVAASVALTLIGCGRRSHESVQKDITAAAEELAQVMDSGLSNADKLAKAKDIAKRLQTLSEEAKQLGEPSKMNRKKVNRTRDRDLAAAQKLEAAAEKLAKKTE